MMAALTFNELSLMVLVVKLMSFSWYHQFIQSFFLVKILGLLHEQFSMFHGDVIIT